MAELAGGRGMVNCSICNVTLSYNGLDRCDDCHYVACVAGTFEPGSLILVVDGALDGGRRKRRNSAPPDMAAGAGLVLARADDEAVVATCAVAFRATDSVQAELEAIKRGLLWSRLEHAYSDCTGAIGLARAEGLMAKFVQEEFRDPLHNLAHQLASVGLHRDWTKYDRLCIPGAVW